MRRLFLKGLAAVLIAGAAAPAVHAEDAAAFYKGKTIHWIVPYNPGGGYDAYSRLIAPYMEKYTGGKIDIVNTPGSGGMKGAVEIFNSPADGTYVGIINGSAMVTNQLAEIKGANYKVGEYSYLGRIVSDPRVFAVGTNSGIKSFEDMQTNGKTTVVGATGLGGSTYVDAVIIGDVFNMDQKVVHGFDRSGDIRTAILRGDVQAMWGSLGSNLKSINSGDLKIVLYADDEKRPIYGDAPSIWDVAKKTKDPARATKILKSWQALNDVGRPVAGPPGIPADRLAFLQAAFDKVMHDPEFVAAAKKNKRDLLFASGDKTLQIAKDATDLEPDIKALFVKAIRGEI